MCAASPARGGSARRTLGDGLQSSLLVPTFQLGSRTPTVGARRPFTFFYRRAACPRNPLLAWLRTASLAVQQVRSLHFCPCCQLGCTVLRPSWQVQAPGWAAAP